MTLRIPRLIQDYCEAFAEYRKRTGYTPYSTRLAFDMMDDSTIGYAVDKAKLAIFNEYGTVNDEGEWFVVGTSVAIPLQLTVVDLTLMKGLAELGNLTVAEWMVRALRDQVNAEGFRGES